jgi:hypothetical protein
MKAADHDKEPKSRLVPDGILNVLKGNEKNTIQVTLNTHSSALSVTSGIIYM